MDHLSKLGSEGLTFDDVLLVPQYSEVLPAEVDLTARLTRRLTIRIPILSAAMDTVTESGLAIALAKEGGFGVLHRNCSPVEQAEEVAKVKRYESGMIVNPVTMTPERPIADAIGIMNAHGIGGIPILDHQGVLVGILTHRDLRFQRVLDRPIAEVMTRAVITAPVGTTLQDAKDILQENRIEKLPVVDERGILRGLITVKDIEKEARHPQAAKDRMGRLMVGAAIGVGAHVVQRVARLIEAGVDAVAVDTAHGHSRRVLDTVALLKKEFASIEIIAGNVATRDGTKALIDAGADAVKVGIGPGSICTTRVVAGIGVPQVTAVAECAGVADEFDVPIIADGGVKFSGDVAKALAAGASTVMIGNLFAGTDEAPGELVLYKGRSYKVYRGMGSVGALSTAISGDRYGFDRGAMMEPSKIVPEGIEGRVPYRGALSASIHQILGGLRSALGYCGAPTLEMFRRSARFVRMTGAGLQESHAHNVIVTKEAPNYRLE